MSCFIDNEHVDDQYRRNMYSIMPSIKKDALCKKCLAEHEEEVEPVNCPLYKVVREQMVNG